VILHLDINLGYLVLGLIGVGLVALALGILTLQLVDWWGWRECRHEREYHRSSPDEPGDVIHRRSE